MKILLFVLIELILYPVTMVGVILFMGVIILVNRPRGISGTAYEPLMNRIIYHDFGMRPDEAAKRLARALPASHPLIWNLIMGPTYLASRFTGYRPKMICFPAEDPATLMSMMTVRTAFFDSTMRDALNEIDQVVILGAGWDTRAYDLPDTWSGRVFEVDTAATQAAKVAALGKADINTEHVTFVAVDFNATSWLEALQAQGFDPELPTYLLWEGVTMYLDEAATRRTLRNTANLATGSRIAFDYFAAELVKGEKPYFLLDKLIPLGIWLTYGEKIRDGIPMRPSPREAIVSYLAEEGLALIESDNVGNWYGFALASRPV